MKKIKYVILMAIMLMAMALCTGCGTTKVDLNEYITISAEGYDSLGRATYTFDRERFLSDYGDKIELNDEVKSAELAADTAASRMLALCVQADLDKAVNLTNGDVVTLKWTCKDELASEYFNCELKYSDIEYEVADLAEVGKIDPFEYLTLSYTGIAPNATITFEVDYNQPEMQYISFSLDKRWPIKNGDTVTITASVQNDINMFVERFGVVPSTTTKEYVVDFLEECVSDASQITEEVIDKMVKQGEDAYRAHVASYWDKPETLKNIEYVGYYLLTAKEEMSTFEGNYMYCVYKVSASNPGTGNPVEYYVYAKYTNLTVLPDGTCNVNLSACSIPDESFRDGKYAYKGYADLNSLCNDEVVSKINTYEYVTTIQE